MVVVVEEEEEGEDGGGTRGERLERLMNYEVDDETSTI